MIHPSYVEMIERINGDSIDKEEAPLVTSRYSIVLATAKRARQLIAGAEPYVNQFDRNGKERKPLSIAVDELYEGKVHILPRDTDDADENGDLE